MTDERKRDLWEAISEYVMVCGGDTGNAPSEGRIRSVSKVEFTVLRIRVDDGAHLERGVYGRGKPTDIYPDWVYEARDAIRRQDENPPHYLPELLAILGWQGGTYHQALKAVQRLVATRKSACNACGYPNDENGVCTREQCCNAN